MRQVDEAIAVLEGGFYWSDKSEYLHFNNDNVIKGKANLYNDSTDTDMRKSVRCVKK